MGQAEEIPEPVNADGTPNVKFTAYGFDELGFFRMCVHEKRGICEVLGLLEQMKDVVKARFIHNASVAREEKQKKGVIVTGVAGAPKGMRY